MGWRSSIFISINLFLFLLNSPNVNAQYGASLNQQLQQQQQQQNPYQSQRFPQQVVTNGNINRIPSQGNQQPLGSMNGQRFAQPLPQPMPQLAQAPPQFPSSMDSGRQNSQLQQQQQQPQQWANPQSRQSGQIRQAGFLKTPARQTSSNPRSILANAATFELRLNSYQNPNLAMPNGWTCDCPQPNACSYLKNIASPCMFSFTVIVSSADQNVHYFSTDFIPFNKSGLVAGRSPDWGLPITLDLTTKPQSVDVFVHNLGPVIEQASGRAIYFDYLVLVDTFVIDLRNYNPLGYGEQLRLTAGGFTGLQVASNLQVSYAVQCKPGFMGPLCELKCGPPTGGYIPTQNFGVLNNPSPSQLQQQQQPQIQQQQGNNNNPNAAVGNQLQQQQPLQQQVQQQQQPSVICSSTLSNISRQCTFTDSKRVQVKNCMECVNGVENNACRNGTSSTQTDQGVSFVFLILTIVFGGILLLLILSLCVFLCILLVCGPRRKKNDRHLHQQPPYNRVQGTTPYGGGGGGYDRSRNPLLRNGDSMAAPRPTIRAGSSATTSDEWAKPTNPPTAVQRGIRAQAPMADANETSPSESEIRFPAARREAQV